MSKYYTRDEHRRELEVYHTNRDCQTLQMNGVVILEKTEEEIQDLRHCHICENGQGANFSNQHPDKDCPFCDDETNNLPEHIREECTVVENNYR